MIIHLEVVEELLVVPEGEDVDALVLTLEPHARALPPAALLHRVPLLLHVPAKRSEIQLSNYVQVNQESDQIIGHFILPSRD